MSDPNNHGSIREELLRLCTAVERDRENFNAVTRELSSISGSLKVLLEDRSEAKNNAQKMFSTMDELGNRVTALETRQAALEAANTTSNTRSWQILTASVGPVIAAIVTYLFVKR